MKTDRLSDEERARLLQRLSDLQGNVETLKAKIEGGLTREKTAQTLRYLAAAMDVWREGLEEEGHG